MIDTKNILIIAHRGESHLAPENTLAAINLAWENGVKAVEIDVQLTLDNEIVVIHDKNTCRVGNINLSIANSNLNALKKVDVGLFKDKKWKGEHIPTLMEVIQTIPKEAKLIVEIKCETEIIEPLCALLKNAPTNTSNIEFISFNYNVLTTLKKRLPQYKMLWLLDLDYFWPAWIISGNMKKKIKKVRQGNLDGVNVWAGKKLNNRFMEQWKKHNYLVYTWTTNNLEKSLNLIKLEVDAITTDRATWLTKHIKNCF